MAGEPKTIALVLAGAVARGAFEAGVIRALVDANVRIVRIIAASSGALNGSLLASCVRAGNVKAGAAKLLEIWRDHAAWNQVFHASVHDLLVRDGISDQKLLLRLLRDNIQPAPIAHPTPINLRLVVAPLNGVPGMIGDQPATTFESIRDFNEDAFATPTGLDAMFEAATASAAFPGVFAPVRVADIGPCVDGGTVNNTPVKWALDGAVGQTVDAVVVVSTAVEQFAAPATELHGVGLIGHLAEMLIDERLFRDLRDTAASNVALTQLAALVAQGVITADQRAKVVDAIGWTGRRVIECIRIRPVTAIAGNAFSGFFSKDVRAELLEAGFQRGQDVLGGLGWLD